MLKSDIQWLSDGYRSRLKRQEEFYQRVEKSKEHVSGERSNTSTPNKGLLDSIDAGGSGKFLSYDGAPEVTPCLEEDYREKTLHQPLRLNGTQCFPRHNGQRPSSSTFSSSYSKFENQKRTNKSRPSSGRSSVRRLGTPQSAWRDKSASCLSSDTNLGSYVLPGSWSHFMVQSYCMMNRYSNKVKPSFKASDNPKCTLETFFTTQSLDLNDLVDSGTKVQCYPNLSTNPHKDTPSNYDSKIKLVSMDINTESCSMIPYKDELEDNDLDSSVSSKSSCANQESSQTHLSEAITMTTTHICGEINLTSDLVEVIQAFRLSDTLGCVGKSMRIRHKPRGLPLDYLMPRPTSVQADFQTDVQQFIDTKRPLTAPFRRKDLQSFTAFKQHAYLPHYCHFVKGITLKGRGGAEDDDDDGYNTNSETSPTDSDVHRKNQRDGIRHENSRSSSVVDLDIEPESQMARLSGTVRRRNDIQRAGLDPMLDQGRVTALVDDAKTTLGSVWDGNRPPIRIPSPDIESIESTRTKVDEMANILHELTTKTTKDVARSELTSAKTKRHCPKKGKTPGGGRGRKKRGKKKKHGADGNHRNEDVERETTQNSEGKDAQFPQSNYDEQTAVNLNVPDLPTLNVDEHGKQPKKSQKKTKKSLIIAPVVLNKPSSKDSTPTTTYSFYEFGDLTASEPKVDDESAAAKGEVTLPTHWNDRMALSLQSSRFELPMDLRLLEALSPQDYLRKYCVVIPRRKLLYRNTFQQHRNKKGGIVGKRSLCTALTDVMINSMTVEQAEQLCDLLEVGDKTEVDLDLFSGIAALAERILYPEFVTEDTWNRTEYQKEMIESADFCGLEWKLRGVNVSHQVKRILKSI